MGIPRSFNSHSFKNLLFVNHGSYFLKTSKHTKQLGKINFSTSNSLKSRRNDDCFKNSNIPTSSTTNSNKIIGILGGFVVSGLAAYFIYNSFSDNPEKKDLIRIEEELKAHHEKKNSTLVDLQLISQDEAEKILTNNENSYTLSFDKGLINKKAKIYYNQVASNNPTEDRLHVETKIVDNQLVLGVFDGHAGFKCSEYVSKHLPQLVRQALTPLFKNLNESKTDSSIIERMKSKIQEVFCQLDDEIVHNSLKLKDKSRESLFPGYSGCCALLASIDLANNHLFVACTGDSRAVLGRIDSKGNWIASPLTEDQTSLNPKELMRILSEHPGEEKTAVQRNRVLGMLAPSRAFGDAIFKWDLSTQLDILPIFFPERRPPLNLLTPPYVTAKPEVTYHKINPRHDEFMILATDGLYDELSNEQIVSLVGDHIASSSQKNTEKDAQVLRKKKNSDLTCIFQDSNAATHLIRNAFGGGIIENNNGKISSPLVLKLLSISAPDSRDFRDDISVIVLHLGNTCPIIEE